MTTTDLKAAAEAAKAATAAYIAYPTDRETGRQWDRACAEFSLACTEDAILALIRERDEARAERDDLAQSLKQIMVADREAAEASLASYKEEVERLRGALGTIADLHIPDQPAHFGGDELEWAQRHVGTLRRLAIETLTKEPPHAE